MTQLGPGRPRLATHRPQGHTPRAEILDAAAELFTTNGCGNTSTRAIAEAVLRVLGWTGDLAVVGASAENSVHPCVYEARAAGRRVSGRAIALPGGDAGAGGRVRGRRVRCRAWFAPCGGWLRRCRVPVRGG
ncbi:helix-turn-helix transcriptional regulator [Nocardia speluncae]|uniref:Helix-turn-helix transcriptional regulator n=1 Tax=Nocardia speluncae TaxID=419477 RepID=A0A846XQ83_9NOCA|nr:helix-turn-helix transcriptional regulator [Nocardia speluncae]